MLPQVSKLMQKERVPTSRLCQVAREVVAGRLGAGEADLGNGLFKKCLARPGGGKSGGYRAIVAYHQPHTGRVLFAFMFAKNVASALTEQGQLALSSAATVFVAANDAQVAALAAAGDAREIECDEEG